MDSIHKVIIIIIIILFNVLMNEQELMMVRSCMEWEQQSHPGVDTLLITGRGKHNICSACIRTFI